MDCMYEVYETGNTTFDKSIGIFRDRNYAIGLANKLNNYFSLYSDNSPIYNVRPVNGYAGKITDPPKLSTLLYNFDEEGDIRAPELKYSELQSQLIDMLTEPEAILFYGDEDSGSYYCEGKLRIDVSDAAPDKRYVLMKRAHERFKYINSLVEMVFGHNLEYMVNESDWYDLDEKFAPVIRQVNEYLYSITVTDLETYAAMVINKANSEPAPSDSK